MACENIKTALTQFKYGLYFALLAKLVMPSIYLTFRASILGSSSENQLTIASQMAWVNVILEMIEESLLMPLYFCFGCSITNLTETKNKTKTGLIIAFIAYTSFSCLTSAIALPLVKTVVYVRIELGSIVFSSLAKFLMLLFIMMQWNLVIYSLLSMSLDYTLATVADLQAFGIGYSSCITNFVLLTASLMVTWRKLEFSAHGDIFQGQYDYKWLKSWSKVGFFSGLDSLIRNLVYLIVVMRAMNLMAEQGSYWMANTFIWNWLLMPILPLSDLIKQDVSASLSKPEAEKKSHFWTLFPYLLFNGCLLLLWMGSFPGWNWFIIEILNADKPELIFELLNTLVPCYAIFTFGLIIQSLFYALGRTDLLALKAFIGNCLIVTLFLLFSNEVLFPPLMSSVAIIFGVGLVTGSILTFFFEVCFLSRIYPLL